MCLFVGNIIKSISGSDTKKSEKRIKSLYTLECLLIDI